MALFEGEETEPDNGGAAAILGIEQNENCEKKSFLPKQWCKIKQRVKHPDFWALTKRDIFNGMEDAVEDHMKRNNIPLDDPDWRQALNAAKAYDRGLPIIGFPGSFLINEMLEAYDVKNKAEKK
jgi:hypothetical protein